MKTKFLKITKFRKIFPKFLQNYSTISPKFLQRMLKNLRNFKTIKILLKLLIFFFKFTHKHFILTLLFYGILSFFFQLGFSIFLRNVKNYSYVFAIFFIFIQGWLKFPNKIFIIIRNFCNIAPTLLQFISEFP